MSEICAIYIYIRIYIYIYIYIYIHTYKFLLDFYVVTRSRYLPAVDSRLAPTSGELVLHSTSSLNFRLVRLVLYARKRKSGKK